MSLWERVFAAGYDRFMAGVERADLGARRAKLLRGARGRVLELGAGTGVNLDHYGPDVTELVLLEPAEPMARRLEARGLPPHASVVRAGAEALPFDDASFDTVVATLVLCTVPDLDRALDEIRRVLRPGGRLLFLEHVRADDPGLARWQRRLNPIQRRFACGCHLDRPTPEAIGARFEVVELERDRMRKSPATHGQLAVGQATQRQVANRAEQ
jgi:ubiquinone/menaquinone biosynthesis C-methylase UbiE